MVRLQKLQVVAESGRPPLLSACAFPLWPLHPSQENSGCRHLAWPPLQIIGRLTWFFFESAQPNTLGVFRCARPAPGPLACGGSTPKALLHSYTKPYVSPFGFSAHRVPAKSCDTQRRLCGGGGTTARWRLSSWLAIGSWVFPRPALPCPPTHPGCHVLLSGHTGHIGSVRAVLGGA